MQRCCSRMCAMALTACAPLRLRQLTCARSCGSVRYASTQGTTTTTSAAAAATTAASDVTAGVSLDFDYDPMASVRHDAAVQTAAQHREDVARALLPPPPQLPSPPPASAVAKVCAYLEQHPVDELIVHAQVQVTHVQRLGDGVEERVTREPCALAEALAFARQQKMHLVQMGAHDDVAFCRVRDERVWVCRLVQAEVDAHAAAAATATGAPVAGSVHGGDGDRASAAAATATRTSRGGGGAAAAGGSGKLRALVDHAFRDVVDAHFVGWRSKKVCDDLRKGHPVKLTIRDFQSPEAAVQKLREMCSALKTHAEATQVYHYYTSITANDREASVTLSPAMANKSGTVSRTVRHPGEKEWTHALTRMQEACAKVGRAGTYVKSNKLKPRNLGATLYRVDKYGRRID